VAKKKKPSRKPKICIPPEAETDALEGFHFHQCASCGSFWRHREVSPFENEEAHTCPECGHHGAYCYMRITPPANRKEALAVKVHGGRP
jgi:predicted RNA-binding Zn-ribbon protein involved in translation (DUF1610 family)